MAITTALCSSFKQELLMGLHNFLLTGGNAFKIALYTSAATLGAGTTAYAGTNEHGATGNYATGGNTLTRVDPTLSGTTALTDFADSVWSAATITARGSLIYNSTNANRAVCVNDFGADKSSTAGDFTVVFPTADASNAIIRIA